MDLKEIKSIVNFARKAGVKSLKLGDLNVEFKDEIIVQHARKPRVTVSAAVEQKSEEKSMPIPQVPTLDDINKFIYGPTEEAH